LTGRATLSQGYRKRTAAPGADVTQSAVGGPQATPKGAWVITQRPIKELPGKGKGVSTVVSNKRTLSEKRGEGRGNTEV